MSAYTDNLEAVEKLTADLITKAIVAELITIAPFMTPFTKAISLLVGFVVKRAMKQIELAAYIARVDLRVDSESSEYLEASNNYYKALASGDKNEIERTKIILDYKFDAFVRIML